MMIKQETQDKFNKIQEDLADAITVIQLDDDVEFSEYVSLLLSIGVNCIGNGLSFYPPVKQLCIFEAVKSQIFNHAHETQEKNNE